MVLATEPEQIEDLVASSANVHMAVRIPGWLLDQLPPRVSGLLLTTQWTFLVGGWSEPILAMLPEGSRRAQLERELVLLRTAGIDRVAGFVGNGWEPALASLFSELDLDEVFVVWPDDPPSKPVITDHLGDVVTIFAVDETSSAPQRLSTNKRLSTNTSGGQLGRREPPVDRHWAEALDRDAEAGLLYRKMLRLAQRLPERVPLEATEWLESAQAGHWYKPGADRRTAHAALAAARHRIDLARRRPSDWTRLSVLDWDADSSDEVQLETPDLSLVIDPDAGMILYVDHKPSERSISYLPGQVPWRIAQAMVASETILMTFVLTGVEEDRGRVGTTLLGQGIEVGLATRRGMIDLRYRIAGESQWQRFGTEIPLAFSGPIKVRIDGGAWISVSEPIALSGHRFRLEHGAEQVLVTALQPADFFLRPVSGGVVVWANWPLSPFEIQTGEPEATHLGIEYRMTVEING